MNRNFLLLFAFNLLLISSCTIQKRLHRPGYTISSNLSLPSWKKKVYSPDDLDQIESVKKAEPNLSASLDYQSDITLIPPSKAEESELILDVNPSDTIKTLPCDEIVLTSGEIIKGERLVQLNQKVYYTPCGSQTKDRPFVMEKFVKEIHYKDGKTLVINNYSSTPVVTENGKLDYVNRQKVALAVVSIVLSSIGLPGVALFGIGGALGLVGLILAIIAGNKSGGAFEFRIRRLIIAATVLGIIVFILGLAVLAMWTL